MHAVWGQRHEAENTSNETVRFRDAFVSGDRKESPEDYVHSIWTAVVSHRAGVAAALTGGL